VIGDQVVRLMSTGNSLINNTSSTSINSSKLVLQLVHQPRKYMLNDQSINSISNGRLRRRGSIRARVEASKL